VKDPGCGGKSFSRASSEGFRPWWKAVVVVVVHDDGTLDD